MAKLELKSKTSEQGGLQTDQVPGPTNSVTVSMHVAMWHLFPACGVLSVCDDLQQCTALDQLNDNQGTQAKHGQPAVDTLIGLSEHTLWQGVGVLQGVQVFTLGALHSNRTGTKSGTELKHVMLVAAYCD